MYLYRNYKAVLQDGKTTKTGNQGREDTNSKTEQKEHSTPLFLTSSFTYDSAEDMAAAFATESPEVNIYSRFSNPGVDEFVHKMASLEGAEHGVATGTGMAAIFSTFMTFLSKGDHIISASAVFGSTHTILTKYLPKWGLSLPISI